MFTEMTKVETFVAALVAKGWTETKADVEGKFNGVYWTFKSAWIYPKAKVDGEQIAASAIYFPDYRVNETSVANEIAKHQTAKEYRLGKLLDAIREVRDSAERMGLSAELTNPLSAIAEQLSSNAIEHHTDEPNFAEVEDDFEDLAEIEGWVDPDLGEWEAQPEGKV